MIYTPDMRDGNTVFVFGSNSAGRHGAGAALTAWKHWGACRGVGEGRSGDSYGIPTKDERLQPRLLGEISLSVFRFRLYALQNSETRFLLTKIGCGLAGYEEFEIAPMFHGMPLNVVMPEGWTR